MKSLALLALVLASAHANAAAPQKFVRTSLMYFVNGPGDFASPFMHDRCSEAEQAQAQKSAEDSAKMDCEKAPGVKDCLVKYSRITFNSAGGERIPEDTLNKYGLHTGGDGYGYWGCEAEALVYGLTD